MTSMRQSITRNTVFNFAGIGVPLLVGIVVLPIITSSLGPARFGLLGLTLALLEYSNLFNFGLGLATTKHVAERLARGDGDVSQLVVGSVLSQTALGALGGLMIALAAPILTHHVFVIPEVMKSEALSVFRILGLMVPATLLLVSLRSVLEAAHRFDISNAIRIPGSIASFLIPAIAASRGHSLVAIMLMLLASRLVVCAAMFIAARIAIPSLHWSLPENWSVMRPLLVFGGWLSLSNVISPLLIYVDRLMLGAFIGLTAVGYYTAPFDAVMRLLIVPASLVGALFPSVTGMHATGDTASLKRIFGKAVQNISLILAGPALLLVVAGPIVLRLWLGDEFAAAGGTALRILAFGVFMNALAHVPSGYLAALGRPDISAKFHLVELLVHVPVAWWLITRFGITGAAIAWAMRVTFDTALLLVAASRVMGTSFRELMTARPSPLTVKVAQGSC